MPERSFNLKCTQSPVPRVPLIRVSQGVHTYLKEQNVPHIWHVDEDAHDFQHWKEALYQFSQLIFKPEAK